MSSLEFLFWLCMALGFLVWFIALMYYVCKDFNDIIAEDDEHRNWRRWFE